MELIAVGATMRQAADDVKVDVRTIERWLDIPSVAHYLEYVRGLMRSQRWAKREAHIAAAYDTVKAAMDGTMHPEDPRVPIALAILQQTEHAIYNPDQRADVSIKKRRPGAQDGS
jgi:hypothetical protein